MRGLKQKRACLYIRVLQNGILEPVDKKNLPLADECTAFIPISGHEPLQEEQ